MGARSGLQRLVIVTSWLVAALVELGRSGLSDGRCLAASKHRAAGTPGSRLAGQLAALGRLPTAYSVPSMPRCARSTALGGEAVRVAIGRPISRWPPHSMQRRRLRARFRVRQAREPRSASRKPTPSRRPTRPPIALAAPRVPRPRATRRPKPKAISSPARSRPHSSGDQAERGSTDTRRGAETTAELIPQRPPAPAARRAPVSPHCSECGPRDRRPGPAPTSARAAAARSPSKAAKPRICRPQRPVPAPRG